MLTDSQRRESVPDSTMPCSFRSQHESFGNIFNFASSRHLPAVPISGKVSGGRPQLRRYCRRSRPGKQPLFPGPPPHIPGPEPFLPGPERFIPGPEPLLPGPGRLLPGPEPFIPGPERLLPGPEPFIPRSERLLPRPESLFLPIFPQKSTFLRQNPIFLHPPPPIPSFGSGSGGNPTR